MLCAPPSSCWGSRVTSWAAVARRIRVPVGFAFAVLYFWLARPELWSLLAGSAVAALGLLLRAIASGHVRKNEALTTTGPYAYVRNPLYLGSLIAAAGFALAARSLWLALAMLIIFVFVYVPVIRSEEAFLRARFPEFQQYMQQVPRLFPRGTAPMRSRGSFSWKLYCQHREYNALLGALLMTAALAIKMMWFSK